MNEILQKTYDILDAKGWCQGVHQDGQGRVCLEAAFALASGSPSAARLSLAGPEAEAAWKLLCDTVRVETGRAAPCIWNDLPTTTVEDVKLVLRKAING